MPVSPEKQKTYPGGSLSSREWKALRAAVLKRAGDCCEGSPLFPDCRAANGAPHPVTGSKVVLTVAHMDQNPANSDPNNLRALCQRCHNAHDAPYRRGLKTPPASVNVRNHVDVLAEIFARGGLSPLGSRESLP